MTTPAVDSGRDSSGRDDNGRDGSGRDTSAIVVVTFNRSHMLEVLLDGLTKLDPAPDAVYVVDNASTDRTPQLLAERELAGTLPLHVIRSEENLGGSGGFSLGVRTAFAAGWDRLWLMDDDVVPAPDSLGVLLAHRNDCLVAVREDPNGYLVERAAITFDLRNPLAILPKRASVDTVWKFRPEMPAEVEVQNTSFEGFMLHRRVIERIGFPDPTFFIFYDDVDYAIRARRAGFAIVALRDAAMIRQLPLDQERARDTWKGYYMYRNLFAVHFRYGENRLVRGKPYLVAVAVTLLSPWRGGRTEASNVLRGVRDARRMRRAAADVVSATSG